MVADMQKLFIPLYRFIWSYWIHEDDKIVKVISFKTALVDRHGQRVKSSPMIWRTIKEKYYRWKFKREW